MRILIKSLFSAIFLSMVFLPNNASTDVVTMKDNRVLKGVVVEDYHDRIVISTYEGEKFLNKSEIVRLVYDSEFQNLLHLAEMAVERGRYVDAYGYYEKASTINPDSRKAKDGRIYTQTLLFKKRESRKMAEIERRSDYEKHRAPRFYQKTIGEQSAKLKKELGITLRMGEVSPQIIDVVSGSSAFKAGIEAGDYIVEIWGRLTGYMDLKQVLSLLLEKSPKERKITLERTVRVKISKERGFLPNSSKLIGSSFVMKLDGLTVEAVQKDGFAERAGLKQGDLVIALDGSSTRYMPHKIAVEMIQTSKKDYVDLTIRREISLW